MTKVEINGKTYCVETLIYEVERLKKDVKAGAEIYRFTLNRIQDEIKQVEINGYIRDVECFRAGLNTAVKIIDKYKGKE